MITFYDFLSEYEVELPDPILGNSEQLNIKTKFEYSMARQVHSSIKTISHSKLLMTFDLLEDTDKINLESFLLSVRGRVLFYKDYLDETWLGMLLGDPFEFTHVGHNDCGNLWSISLEFEAINS